MTSPMILNFRAVLLDLDGTLYHEIHPLPGAAELVGRIQAAGIPIACISNSTTSAQRIVKRLEAMGMTIRPDQVYSAAAEVVEIVLEEYAPMPRIFNLATEGIHEMLDGQVHWVEKPDEPCDVVVAGTYTNVYATPDRQRIGLDLLRAGADLIGICADRIYPSPRGIEFGCGAFTSMLAYASGRPPRYCGKPQPHFFRKLLDRLAVEPGAAVVIGDNLESDIAGGKCVGLKTILTLTGVVSRAEAESAAEALRPDHIINDLRELL